MAEAFVQEGINVVLNGRTKEKLVRAAAQIGQSDRLFIVSGDITQPETAKRIINAAVEHFGQVSILVNNAGIFYSRPFTAYTVDELDIFLRYMRGAFILTQEVVQQMQK